MNARFAFAAVLLLAVCLGLVRPATAALNPHMMVQVVNAPLIGLGDDPRTCQSAISDPSMNCIAYLADGDIAVYVSWQPCHDSNCAGSVQKFTIYRVPPGLTARTGTVLPLSAAVAPSPSPTVLHTAISHGIAIATPTPSAAPMHVSPQAITQIPLPSDHVVVGGGSWRGVYSFFGQQTVGLVGKPKLGQCFVARVATAGGWESADSNEVCIDGSTKYGLETVSFSGDKTQAWWNVPDLSPGGCLSTYLNGTFIDYSNWQVGRSPFSQTVGNAAQPCTGTQVWETLTSFDPGSTKFPIWKAELITSGDASCVTEVDLVGGDWERVGGNYTKKSWPSSYMQQTVSPSSTIDLDVTNMLNYQVGGGYFSELFRGFAFVQNASSQCMSALSGFTLKVTRLR